MLFRVETRFAPYTGVGDARGLGPGFPIGAGSAIAVSSPDGCIAWTAHHVVVDSAEVALINADGERFPVTSAIYSNREEDIVGLPILRANCRPVSYEPMPPDGSKVAVVGFPAPAESPYFLTGNIVSHGSMVDIPG